MLKKNNLLFKLWVKSDNFLYGHLILENYAFAAEPVLEKKNYSFRFQMRKHLYHRSFFRHPRSVPVLTRIAMSSERLNSKL